MRIGEILSRIVSCKYFVNVLSLWNKIQVYLFASGLFYFSKFINKGFKFIILNASSFNIISGLIIRTIIPKFVNLSFFI